MEENIQFTELDNSLKNLKYLSEKIMNNLNNVSHLIDENINSGVGVWDSENASIYRNRWETLKEDFPKIIETFHAQESNLASYINSIKNVEE